MEVQRSPESQYGRYTLVITAEHVQEERNGLWKKSSYMSSAFGSAGLVLVLMRRCIFSPNSVVFCLRSRLLFHTHHAPVQSKMSPRTPPIVPPIIAAIWEGDDVDKAPEATAVEEPVAAEDVDVGRGGTLVVVCEMHSVASDSVILNSSDVANNFPSPVVPFELDTRNFSVKPVPVGSRVPTSTDEGIHEGVIVTKPKASGTGSARMPSEVITADAVNDVLPSCASCTLKY